jgi:hypothetical protein
MEIVLKFNGTHFDPHGAIVYKIEVRSLLSEVK